MSLFLLTNRQTGAIEDFEVLGVAEPVGSRRITIFDSFDSADAATLHQDVTEFIRVDSVRTDEAVVNGVLCRRTTASAAPSEWTPLTAVELTERLFNIIVPTSSRPRRIS